MEKGEIKEVLEGMLKTLKKEEIELYKALIDKMHYKTIEDVEDFYLGLVYPFERFLSGLIEIEISDNDDVKFILKRSQFVESHFMTLIQTVEGSACCADKSRTIMSGLLGFYKDGRLIVFDYKQQYTFHLPKTIFKTHESIIGFYEGLRGLYCGNPERYLRELLKIQVAHKKEEVAEENKDDVPAAQ